MSDERIIDHNKSFSSFSNILDNRILRALGEQGFARPTLVQAKAIPLALEGRDILARARTGSGKTAAYCIPIVQKILNTKATLAASDPLKQVTRALILVPTRELAEQVTLYLKKLVNYCEGVSVANIAAGTATHLQRVILSDKPDLVVATPARALNLLQSKALNLNALDSLVIDEADLILSYGHDEDVRSILTSGSYLPKVFQSFLMSATMTKDVQTLKGLVLRNPAILRLEEDEDESANLTQYYVKCNEVDKFLLTYVILKLKLIKGKCILFVNEVERCYRLKLFLEQFSIKSCVLNSELPINSRFHIVQEFNKGVYDYIIATDETGVKVEQDSGDEVEDDEEEEVEAKEDFVATQRTSSVEVSQRDAGGNDNGDDNDDDDDEEEEDEEHKIDHTEQQSLTEANVLDQDQEKPSGSNRRPIGTLKRKRASTPVSSPNIVFPTSTVVTTDNGPEGTRSFITTTTITTAPGAGNEEETVPKSKKRKRTKTNLGKDREYGVSRGIDFINVAAVINFDLPHSSRAYTHRVGRTARAGRSGVALSFVVSKEEHGKNKILTLSSAIKDEIVFGKIEKDWAAKGAKIKEWTFERSQVDGFRYRMDDALRSVTASAIKEARIKELKQELLNSDKLKAHFEDNPMDLDYLRHDKPLHPTRIQSHMKYVPAYLLPKNTAVAGDVKTAPSAGAANETTGTGFVPFKKNATRGKSGFTSTRGRGRSSGFAHRGRKKSDPLKKFGG